jgi:hypothetical protein
MMMMMMMILKGEMGEEMGEGIVRISIGVCTPIW